VHLFHHGRDADGVAAAMDEAPAPR
jgi:hypothetical protein